MLKGKTRGKTLPPVWPNHKNTGHTSFFNQAFAVCMIWGGIDLYYLQWPTTESAL